MPPKQATAAKPKTRLNPRRRGKGKGKGKQKEKRRKLNLKGWLKTAADWARFNAWAKINALPRKIPEPEPIVRESRPLSQLKKRLEVISKPSPKPEGKSICRLDLSVSKAALKAKPSKRIKELAMFVWKNEDCGQEFPIPISKAALHFEPSPRIIELSKPHIREVESCNDLEVQKSALEHKTSKFDKRMSLAIKKAQVCMFTDEEMAKLFRPSGIRETAFTYKITDWVSILALPSFRYLKDRKDTDAVEMKKQLEENESTRGKQALEEFRKREAEEAEKRKQKKMGKKGSKKRKKDQVEPAAEEKEKTENEMTPEEKKKKKEEEKRANARKKWKTDPSPCKSNSSISKAAQNAKISSRTEELAKPHIHVNESCNPNAFEVEKSALTGSIEAWVSRLYVLNHPLDPVERPPPREKNEYGVPIFQKPEYGKRLPEVPPYKMGECKDEDDKKAENAKKDAQKKNKEIKPVSLFPSIDPYIDLIGAKKQAKARKAAKEKRKADMEKKKNEKGKEMESGEKTD